MTAEEERRLVWQAVIERIGDLSAALHVTLDAVARFPQSDAESLAVNRALGQLDVAVARYQDNIVPRIVAGGWPASVQGRQG